MFVAGKLLHKISKLNIISQINFPNQFFGALSEDFASIVSKLLWSLVQKAFLLLQLMKMVESFNFRDTENRKSCWVSTQNVVFMIYLTKNPWKGRQERGKRGRSRVSSSRSFFGTSSFSCKHLFVFIFSDVDVPLGMNKNTNVVNFWSATVKHRIQFEIFWKENNFFTITDRPNISLGIVVCSICTPQATHADLFYQTDWMFLHRFGNGSFWASRKGSAGICCPLHTYIQLQCFFLLVILFVEPFLQRKQMPFPLDHWKLIYLTSSIWIPYKR